MLKREAFFLETPDGPRFAVLTRPPGSRVKGGWIYIHPFAEEMNKSRRMVSVATAAFAERGWMVLQADLKGCGDSADNFEDADWQDWITDLSHFWAWLEQRCEGHRGLWTLRAGCLVAADWLAGHSESPPLLLWQPTPSGDRHLTQFLRLKAVNEVLRDSDARAPVKKLREDLNAGKTVEVAGYGLSPGLAQGLGAARLRVRPEYAGPIALLEVSSAESAALSPASRALAEEWRGSGISVHDALVRGASFWQTTEIESAPELNQASLQAFEELGL